MDSSIVQYVDELQWIYLHPGTAFGTAENCLDYLHVGDSIFNWRGNAGIVQYRLRKLIALDCVLVADGKQSFLDLGSMFIPYFAGSIRRCVERNFDLDASRSAEDVHPLIGN